MKTFRDHWSADFSSYLTRWHVIIKLSDSVLYSNARRKLLTSGSVAASVTQAQIHVIKYMANFVIFLVCVCGVYDVGGRFTHSNRPLMKDEGGKEEVKYLKSKESIKIN